MEEPDEAVEVEGWSAAVSPEVCGDGGATMGEAGGTRVPEGPRSQGRSELHGRADGGAKGLKVASGGRDEGMAGFSEACRRGRLGEEAGSMMDRTGGDGELSMKDRTGVDD